MRPYHPAASNKPKIKSLLRLSLALMAAAAVLSLAVVTDALARAGAHGSGPKFSSNGGSFGSSGKSTGRSNGGSKTTDGGKTTTDGGERPRKPPKWRTPILGIPAIVGIGVATPTLGAINASQGGGGQNSSAAAGRSNLPPLRVGIPPADERRYVPDHLLVELSAAQSQALGGLLQRHRLTQVEALDLNGGTLALLRIADRRSVPEVLRALAGEGVVAWAQPNYLYTTQEQQSAIGPQSQAPDAGGDSAQYALAKLRLPQAHEFAKGDKVLVAVIDSTIDTTHPELAGMVVESFNALATAEQPHDHGTAIAGAIASHAKLTGAAPQARLLAVAAFGAKPDTAEGTTFNIIRGIDWALAKGARIINMSFTGPTDPQIARRLAAAHKNGVVLVAAAGNAGPKSPALYPAAYPGVIAVTATDADDQLFKGANQGKHIAVAAPGVDILLAAPEGTYQIKTGTSFAAAEVSGVAALMLERKPELSGDGVRQILTTTARDLGPKGSDPQFGAGLVDAYRAVMALNPAVATTGAK